MEGESKDKGEGGRKADDACVVIPSYFYSFVPNNFQITGKDM